MHTEMTIRAISFRGNAMRGGTRSKNLDHSNDVQQLCVVSKFSQLPNSSRTSRVRHSTMNEEHTKICSSAEWAEYVERDLLPWALGVRNLGDDVLEVGPE